MRALVTGSAGFAGPYLVRALESGGHEVTGFDLRSGDDVRDYEHVRRAVDACQPDLIFHLAGVTWPRESLTDPRRTLDVNLAGALNVLEAVRHTGSHARVLLAGTSEEYGYEGRGEGERLTEDSACRPTTAYGVSKLAASTLGMVYARRHDMHVTVTRAFNHAGWGRQAVNAESAFARRIVAVERGQAASVPHGDLSAHRNYSNVRDVVAAYCQVISLEPGIYNVCSDDTIPLSRIMAILTGLSEIPAVILEKVPSLGTADRGTFPHPSHEKLTGACGWVPRIPLAVTLGEVLDYWRTR